MPGIPVQGGILIRPSDLSGINFGPGLNGQIAVFIGYNTLSGATAIPSGITATTQPFGTDTLQIATTEFVQTAMGGRLTSVFLPSGVDIGSGGNTYVVNPSPAVESVFGASFTFTTSHANTGAATLNASGTGAIALRTLARLPLTGGEIVGGTQTYQATFDGSFWLLAGTRGTGSAASPAGTLNLSGAYVIPTPNVGNNASAGFTILTSPLSSLLDDRSLLNFIMTQADSAAQNLYASFGFDGDDVFILTGSVNKFAIEVPVELFDPFSVINFQTGDAVTIQSQVTPSAPSAGIVILAPLSLPNAGQRMWEVNATTGLTLSYGGIATVSNGQPAEYATVDLTGQTAAITTTTLYTPTATGMFRVSVYAKVTTPDGASSSLGGTTGLTIGYTDGTDSVAQTTVAQLAKETGATGIVNAGNTTATKLLGSVMILAKTGVAITYAFDYTSGTPATMAYELHLKLEAL
jgi:hypothetical protein